MAVKIVVDRIEETKLRSKPVQQVKRLRPELATNIELCRKIVPSSGAPGNGFRTGNLHNSSAIKTSRFFPRLIAVFSANRTTGRF
jgi:hypothetical protein